MPTHRVKTLSFLSTLVLAACGGSPPNPASQAQLTLSGRGAAATTPSAQPSMAGAVALPSGVTVTEVKVLVRKLKMEGAAPAPVDAAATADTSTRSGGEDDGMAPAEHEQDDGSEPALGPCVVDLTGASLGAGLDLACAAGVPAGSFRELKVVIGPSSAVSDPDLAGGASIVVKGTVTDAAGTAPFTFASSLVLEIDREEPLTLSAAQPSNLTVGVDFSTWFGDAGALLDPRDPASRAAIEARIEASLDAFQDDDHSGRDDHGGADGQGGSGSGGGSGGGGGGGGEGSHG